MILSEQLILSEQFATQNNQSKIFSRLLKEKRLYVAYIRGIKNLKDPDSDIFKNYFEYRFNGDFVSHLKKRAGDTVFDCLSNLIWRSFVWAETPEGRVWDDLVKWLNKLSYQQKKNTDNQNLKQ